MGPRGKIFASSFPQCLTDPHEPGLKPPTEGTALSQLALTGLVATEKPCP